MRAGPDGQVGENAAKEKDERDDKECNMHEKGSIFFSSVFFQVR